MQQGLLPAVSPAQNPGHRWRKGEVPRGARPWAPGQSGNPSGKSSIHRTMESVCRSSSVEAAERLVELMRDDDPRIAGWAADKVLDRAWGKPKDYDPSTEQPDNPAIDPSQFTPAQRKQLRRMLEMLLKAMPADAQDGPEYGPSEVIEGQAVENK